jgi:hypothetical protein
MEAGLISQQLAKFFLAFYHSYFFVAIKLILAIYVTVLFANIVMILVIRGLAPYYRPSVQGMNIPVISKNKMSKKWNKIRRRLDTENISQYKLAIIEADKAIDKILKEIGYAGENMSERLSQVMPAHLDDVEKLKWAHEIRNQIIHEENFEISKDTTEEVLKTYEEVLKNLEYL